MSAHLIQQLLAELLEEYIGSAATQTAGESGRRLDFTCRPHLSQLAQLLSNAWGANGHYLVGDYLTDPECYFRWLD